MFPRVDKLIKPHYHTTNSLSLSLSLSHILINYAAANDVFMHISALMYAFFTHMPSICPRHVPTYEHMQNIHNAPHNQIHHIKTYTNICSPAKGTQPAEPAHPKEE
jgi:hypothetical protein